MYGILSRALKDNNKLYCNVEYRYCISTLAFSSYYYWGCPNNVRPQLLEPSINISNISVFLVWR